jgi:thioredoxin reductase (NADPH)
MRHVKVYGADWCPRTRQALKLLQELNVPYEYINVEENPLASAWVKRQNNGKELKPTVDVEGRILSEPSNEELEAAVV